MLIGIVGESGTGKSTGLRNLDPAETFIINVARKELPWKNSMSVYNTKAGNYVETDSYEEIVKWINTVNKLPKFKNIIIEDAQYIMSFEFMERASEKGYDKFSDIGAHINKVFQAGKNTRKDLKVYVLIHSDVDKDPTGKTTVKMKTVGKMVDQYITPEGLFTVVLYTHVKFNKDKVAEYNFVTNRQQDIPAKSPIGMFKSLYIPNDITLVSKAIDDFYGITKETSK